MLIVIFGESCTGKSTLAAYIKQRHGATVYSGNDYLRMAKNAAEAEAKFRATLAEAVLSDYITVYIASERAQMALVPEGCLRVRMSAHLDTIQNRFAARMGGTLPPPVAAMLARKHGAFDDAPRDLDIVSEDAPEAAHALIDAALAR